MQQPSIPGAPHRPADPGLDPANPRPDPADPRLNPADPRLLTGLKILLAAVMSWMIYVVISTSQNSNLFKEWHSLAAIPWMRATLWDFYANVLVIYLWVCYKERTLAMRIIWLILLCTLGSIATCAYVLVQLFKLRPGQGLRDLL